MPGRTKLFVGSACLLASGLFFSVVQSPAMYEQAARVPRMTCDQLIKNGPGSHPYVMVTDARLCSGGFVVERDGETGNLDQLLVPAYSVRLREEPKGCDLAILLRVCDSREKDRLFEQPEGVAFTCEARRGASQVEPWLREELAKQYPGIRFDRCWLLTVGLHEPTVARARSLMLYGLSFLAAGVVVGAFAFRRSPRADTGDASASVGNESPRPIDTQMDVRSEVADRSAASP